MGTAFGGAGLKDRATGVETSEVGRGAARGVVLGAVAFSLIASWLMVAGWVDARHPYAVLALSVSDGADTGPPSWWVVAGGLTRTVPLVLVVATAAAAWAHRSRVWLGGSTVALIISGWAASAMAIVGEGAFLTQLFGHPGVFATPDSLLADAGFDFVGGAALVIAAVVLVRDGWQVDAQTLTGLRRWLYAPQVGVAALLGLAALTVVPIAESGNVRVVSATVTVVPGISGSTATLGSNAVDGKLPSVAPAGDTPTLASNAGVQASAR